MGWRTYRDDQRTPPIRNHGPIKGDEAHSQTRCVTKEGIDGDVVRGDPADPVEPGQGGEDVTGKPVPDKAGGGGDGEEALTGHVFLVPLGIRLVQGVEQGRVDEGARPDHARWPNEVFPEETGKRISHELGGETNHDLVAKTEVLPVEDVLRQQEVCCVGTKLDALGHDGDNGVFLDVERAGVQGPDVAESFELCGWKNPLEESTSWESKQLDDDTRHEN